MSPLPGGRQHCVKLKFHGGSFPRIILVASSRHPREDVMRKMVPSNFSLIQYGTWVPVAVTVYDCYLLRITLVYFTSGLLHFSCTEIYGIKNSVVKIFHQSSVFRATLMELLTQTDWTQCGVFDVCARPVSTE